MTHYTTKEVDSIVEDARIAVRLSSDVTSYAYRSHISRLLNVIEFLKENKNEQNSAVMEYLESR